jgi:hypothetical protein
MSSDNIRSHTSAGEYRMKTVNTSEFVVTQSGGFPAKFEI